MSDIAPDGINLREQIARIDRAQAESDKFRAEQAKLTAEAAKLRLDRILAPALGLAATLGAIAALTALILRALPGHP